MVSPVTNLFHSHQIPILLSYRFLYGFRIIIPVVIGMSGLRPARFLFYTIVAGVFWATVVSTMGYAVGAFFQLEASSFEKNFIYVVLGFATFGMLVGYSVKRLVSKNIVDAVN